MQFAIAAFGFLVSFKVFIIGDLMMGWYWFVYKVVQSRANKNI